MLILPCAKCNRSIKKCELQQLLTFCNCKHVEKWIKLLLRERVPALIGARRETLR